MSDPTELKSDGFAPMISRRDVIKILAVAFAGTLPAKSICAAMTGHAQLPDSDARKGLVFSDSDFLLVQQMSEMIIPETDTPGAIAADVHGFMDYHLAKCFTRKERNDFVSGLKKINVAAKKRYGKEFLHCGKAKQTEIFKGMDVKESDYSDAEKSFFKQFKALTLFAYYTSEVGATQELAYQAVPGGYQGSIPFSVLGKAWST